MVRTMMVNRRKMMSMMAAATALASSRQALADGTGIESISLLSGQNTDIARYARPGPYGVPDKAVNVTVDIGGTTRRIFLYIPTNRGTPLVPVVFSHAALSAPKAYDSLLKHWASHGMLVMAPLHQDSVALLGGSVATDLSSVRQSILLNTGVWKDRLNDCGNALDALPGIVQQGGMKLSGHHPLMAGHGLGAFIAQLLSDVRPGGTAYTSQPPLAHDAFSAFLEMSPFGAGVAGLTPASFSTASPPAMVVTGGGDTDVLGDTESTAIGAFSYLPAGYKHLLRVRDMNDSVFYGRNLSDLPTLYCRSVTTIFLLAYGLQDMSILRLLSGSALQDQAEGAISLAYR